MHNVNRRFTIFGLFIMMAALFLSGCATKKFVREEIAKIDPKIAAVSTQLKENSERIDAVDQRARQGITDAAGARGAATTAQTAAAAAQTTATQAGTAAQTAQTAATAAQRSADTAAAAVPPVVARVTAVEASIRGINTLDTYTRSGQVQKVTFANDSDVLSADAKKALDGIAGQVANLRAGYMIEIQGFTDSVGSESYNFALSQRRAESVMRYLVSQKVALSRVAIVGQGEMNPVSDNNTRAGREENRRVEISILRSPLAN